MSLEQEIVTIEFHKDTHIDLIITETIRGIGYNVPKHDQEWKGVRENFGLVVEVPHLQIEFWEGNQLIARIIENDRDSDYMTIEIIGVPEYQEEGFIGQLAIINKLSLKILAIQ